MTASPRHQSVQECDATGGRNIPARPWFHSGQFRPRRNVHGQENCRIVGSGGGPEHSQRCSGFSPCANRRIKSQFVCRPVGAGTERRGYVEGARRAGTCLDPKGRDATRGSSSPPSPSSSRLFTPDADRGRAPSAPPPPPPSSPSSPPLLMGAGSPGLTAMGTARSSSNAGPAGSCFFDLIPAGFFLRGAVQMAISAVEYGVGG